MSEHKIEAIFCKWGLRQKIFLEKLKISRSFLSQKINLNYDYWLEYWEVAKIRPDLLNLTEDLSEVISFTEDEIKAMHSNEIESKVNTIKAIEERLKEARIGLESAYYEKTMLTRS